MQNETGSTPRPGVWLQAALIIAGGGIAFWPALRGGWIWDDTLDLTGNPLLRDAPGLWKIWFQPGGLFDYYPIKFSVQWLQWQLWHEQTLGYHLTNVGLHLCSAFLVWRILKRLGVSQGWIGGLLFAVHPLTVESVAYITELKNTLSLPFLLLAFDAWIDFDASGRRGRYVAAILLFVAAMLCKTSVVMLPPVLLLHAGWKRSRITRSDVRRAAPFFAVSAVLGLVTVWFQRHVAIGADAAAFNPIGGWLARLLCAGSSVAFYFGKAVVPVNLAPVYPRWSVTEPSVFVWLAWPTIAAALYFCWRRRSTWGRHALFGLGWFLLFLLPVIGFVPISSQRFTWVMDHLGYVPLLGLIGLAAAAFSVASEHLAASRRVPIIGGAVACSAVLAWASHEHARIFRSEKALWTGTIEEYPNAWFAYFNRGNLERQEHQLAAAIGDYQQAIRLQPEFADVHYNLGNALRDAGKPDAAVAAYHRALELRPTLHLAHANLAIVLAQQGRNRDAIAECQRALELRPNFAEARLNLGLLLVRDGRPAEAIPQFETLLRQQPESVAAQFNLGNALLATGRAADAVSHYETAARLMPANAQIHAQLARALAATGRNAEARMHYARAHELDPTLPALNF